MTGKRGQGPFAACARGPIWWNHWLPTSMSEFVKDFDLFASLLTFRRFFDQEMWNAFWSICGHFLENWSKRIQSGNRLTRICRRRSFIQFRCLWFIRSSDSSFAMYVQAEIWVNDLYLATIKWCSSITSADKGLLRHRICLKIEGCLIKSSRTTVMVWNSSLSADIFWEISAGVWLTSIQIFNAMMFNFFRRIRCNAFESRFVATFSITRKRMLDVFRLDREETIERSQPISGLQHG
jgi:hypothetical protein